MCGKRNVSDTDWIVYMGHSVCEILIPASTDFLSSGSSLILLVAGEDTTTKPTGNSSVYSPGMPTTAVSLTSGVRAGG